MNKQLLTLAMSLIIMSSAYAQQYFINRSVIACGATSASSNTNRMVGTVGQCIIGQVQNTQNRDGQGFWYQKGNVSTSVERIDNVAPSSLRLEQNYPNPAVSTTMVKFSLPSSGTAVLSVADALGRTFMIIPHGMMDAGTYHATIDVTQMSPGIYFLRLQSDNLTITRRMTVIR